jgi:hypothetical protein
MKYRIVEMESGNFRVQRKNSFFNEWNTIASGVKTLKEAKEQLSFYIAIDNDNKIKKIVEVI